MTTRRRSRAKKEARGLGRLERILLLVPYCVRRPGESIDDLAKRFGASRQEIIEDLELVFMCGLPDYTPADLIEVTVEEDRVYIRMADYFSRPLRLTRSEAIPLYLKAHALLELLQTRDGDAVVPGLDELSSLRSALGKLGSALLPQEGGVAELERRIKVHLETGEVRWLPMLRRAVTENRHADIEYYTYKRDTLTHRRIDPYLVFASMGHWYVSAYCHLAVGRRLFRLDRIRSMELADETFEPPPDATAELPLLYEPGPEDVTVRIRVPNRIAPGLEEYYPIESAKPSRSGWRELRFRTSAFPRWEKLILQLGRDIEVVEPPELAERVRERAARVLRLYAPKRT